MAGAGTSRSQVKPGEGEAERGASQSSATVAADPDSPHCSPFTTPSAADESRSPRSGPLARLAPALGARRDGRSAVGSVHKSRNLRTSLDSPCKDGASVLSAPTRANRRKQRAAVSLRYSQLAQYGTSARP